MTFDLTGVSDKRTLVFTSSTHVTAHGSDPFLVPLYSQTDLTPYQASGYSVRVQYDSVYLSLLDAYTRGTFTPNTYKTGVYGRPGHDTIVNYPGKESDKEKLAGGGAGSTQPLLLLKFQAQMNGEDPQTFAKEYIINYEVALSDTKISVDCADQTFKAGGAQVLSICSLPHVGNQAGVPLVNYMEPASPNPFNPSTTFEYDVAEEGLVTIEVFDELGNVVRTVVQEVAKPGYYTARLEANDLASGVYLIRMTNGAFHQTRRVILKK
jgi:hypothetical protein